MQRIGDLNNKDYFKLVKEKVQTIAKNIIDEVIANRRHLHQNPELSFKEFNTAIYIRSRLDDMNISWTEIANTGTLATITGNLPSTKVIALRADIDALPINEENSVDYCSSFEGVMHACGHDAHSASLLGVAKILNQLRDYFGGTVKLIFQPAEELYPGGAKNVIAEGALSNPTVDAIIGMHVMPSMKAGVFATRAGKLMASMDEIEIKIYGKGGHAAEPHKVIDPIVMSAAVVQALQQLVSRAGNPLTPSVLSFGKIIGDGAINVIPDMVLMEGTFRTIDEDWRLQAHEKIKSIVEGIVKGFGGHCEIEIRKGYPCLQNDESLANDVAKSLAEYDGCGTIEDPGIWMASEDFAYYTYEIRSCFYFFGVGKKEDSSALHTSTFDFDDNLLELSCGAMTFAALKLLQ